MPLLANRLFWDETKAVDLLSGIAKNQARIFMHSGDLFSVESSE